MTLSFYGTFQWSAAHAQLSLRATTIQCACRQLIVCSFSKYLSEKEGIKMAAELSTCGKCVKIFFILSNFLYMVSCMLLLANIWSASQQEEAMLGYLLLVVV